jgi:hypothetical protein
MSTPKFTERLVTTAIAALMSAVPAFFFGLSAGKHQITPTETVKTVVEHEYSALPDRIDVKRLCLVDDEGAIRAELTMSQSKQPLFVMYYETSEPMVRITKNGILSQVEVLDQSGKHTVGIGVEKEPIKQAGAKQSVFFTDFTDKTAELKQTGFDMLWRRNRQADP